MPKLKIDLHVHTNHSDSSSSVKKILESAEKKGLDGIAITDHSTTDAYTEASMLATDLLIIPGVEVETDEGHVLILGISNLPPTDTNIDEIVEYAKREGVSRIYDRGPAPFPTTRERNVAEK